MHFLSTVADIASVLPMDAVPAPPVNNGGAEAAPGFTGKLITNGRNLMIGAIVVLLLAATAFGIAMGALKGNFRKTIQIVLSCLIALVPAGIVLGVGVYAVATGVVGVAGF